MVPFLSVVEWLLACLVGSLNDWSISYMIGWFLGCLVAW